jgi:hypothetical protein
MASKPVPEEDLADALDLSDLYASLAGLNRRARRTDAAAEFERRRTQLWRQWERKLPDNDFVHRQLQASG